MSEPAPTVHFGHNLNEVIWIKRERSGDRGEEGFDPAMSPSQTLTEKARSRTIERPATTVLGDPRISEPGHHDPKESCSQQKNAGRVTVAEASVLQGFSPDYPWQGSRTARFRQIGNAVPPPLAILGALLDA